jgi:hypothetical protein
MKRFVIGLVAATCVAAAGCAPTTTSPISAKAASALSSYVAAVRTAATGKSKGQLAKAVNDLRNEVASLQTKGELTPTRAQKIDDAADALLSDFKGPKPTPSASSTSPTPSVSSPPVSPTPTVTVTVTSTPTSTPTTTGTTATATP